jgi:hypothetical protein
MLQRCWHVERKASRGGAALLKYSRVSSFLAVDLSGDSISRADSALRHLRMHVNQH